MTLIQILAALAETAIVGAVLPDGQHVTLGDPVMQDDAIVLSAFTLGVPSVGNIAQRLQDIQLEGIDLPVRVWWDDGWYAVQSVNDGMLALISA